MVVPINMTCVYESTRVFKQTCVCVCLSLPFSLSPSSLSLARADQASLVSVREALLDAIFETGNHSNKIPSDENGLLTICKKN